MEEKQLKGLAYSAEPDLTPRYPSRLLIGLIIGVIVGIGAITIANSIVISMIGDLTDENTEFLAPIRKAQACQETSKTQEEFDECIK